MKNSIFLFAFLLALCVFCGCEKIDEPPLAKKLDFVDLRRVAHQTQFTIIDDSVAMTTSLKFRDQTIFSGKWEYGIYSGPIIKTRLLWARSESNLNFIIIGFDDLFYKQLMVIKADNAVSSHKIAIINLFESELRENETIIWFNYNNSWIRVGQISDSETQIFL